MQKYSEMSKEQLQALKKELDQQYAEIKAQGLALDMSRGKPSVDQLNISMDMMDVLSSSTDLRCETGVDCRNYGVMDGIPEAKTSSRRDFRSRSGTHYHLRKLQPECYV